MADNELTVLDATGTTRTLRSIDVGSSLQTQPVFVWEGPEVPTSTTGSVVRYTVTSATSVALDPPTAGARFGRLRCYETTGPASPTLRLFYRQDGLALTNPGVDSSTGFLFHGELMLVKLADFTKFVMIAEGGSTYAVWVEWLANA